MASSHFVQTQHPASLLAQRDCEFPPYSFVRHRCNRKRIWGALSKSNRTLERKCDNKIGGGAFGESTTAWENMYDLRLSPNCVTAPERSPRSGNVVLTKTESVRTNPTSSQRLYSNLEPFAIAFTSGGKMVQSKYRSARGAGDTADHAYQL